LLGIEAQRGQEAQLRNVLASNEWSELLDELKPYITDYVQRVVKVEGQFQF
jgi:hypothetical protein